MGRQALAVITAMITAVGIIWVGYMIGTMIAPNTPANLEYIGRGEVSSYMNGFPPAAFAAVAIGYALAAFAGGFIATKMGRRWSQGMTLAAAVGGLLTLGLLVVAFVWPRWPQPAWFIVLSLILFIPFSLVGYKLANKAV